MPEPGMRARRGVERVEDAGLRKMAEELLTHCFLNVAASLLKLGAFDDAIYACSAPPSSPRCSHIPPQARGLP